MRSTPFGRSSIVVAAGCSLVLFAGGCHASADVADAPAANAPANDPAAQQRQRDAAERLRRSQNPAPPHALFRVDGRQAIPIYCQEELGTAAGESACGKYLATGGLLGLQPDLALPIDRVETTTCVDPQGTAVQVAMLGAPVPPTARFAAAPADAARPEWGTGASPLLAVLPEEARSAARAELARSVPASAGKSWAVTSEEAWSGFGIDELSGSLATVWQPEIRVGAVLLFRVVDGPTGEEQWRPSVLLVEQDLKLAIIETLMIGAPSHRPALVVEGLRASEEDAAVGGRALRVTGVYAFAQDTTRPKLESMGVVACPVSALSEASGESVPSLDDVL